MLWYVNTLLFLIRCCHLGLLEVVALVPVVVPLVVPLAVELQAVEPEQCFELSHELAWHSQLQF